MKNLSINNNVIMFSGMTMFIVLILLYWSVNYNRETDGIEPNTTKDYIINFLPKIILVVIISIGILVISSMIGISLNDQINHNDVLTRVVTYDAEI